MKTQIMYIEGEGDSRYTGRIGRVSFSKTGKTIYYKDFEFVKIRGYKTNHLEVNSNYEFWLSNPKKQGNDTLYPGLVYVDEDVREEYWLDIRKCPENIQLDEYRCSGKYSRRKPNAELNVNGNARNGGDRSQQR